MSFRAYSSGDEAIIEKSLAWTGAFVASNTIISRPLNVCNLAT
jgi:hypothetical protein